MRVLLILAHPDPASFNHAIAAEALAALRRNGHEVACHDLYRERFDPLLPAGEIARDAPLDPTIERHCRELAAAEGVLIVHPNWWGAPPAVLKGWIDRVFRAGVAYRFLEGDGGDGVPAGLLVARAALVFNTSNTPEGRELAVFGDPLETLWRNCVFGLCSVARFERRMYRVMCTSTLEERRRWLEDVRCLTEETFPAVEAVAEA
jgi:putative NADPH-quinone reductase